MNNDALLESLSFMDPWLRLRVERSGLPGLVVTIAHKGKVVFNQAYGYANLEKKEKLTPKHIFRVASHSKTFTAVAILQLQEKGRLRIDDNVIDHLSWSKDHKDQRFAEITIRQLLSHSAGLIRDGLDRDYMQFEGSYPDMAQLQREILEADLVFDTNVQMKYSNFGYALLGMIIETVSGQSFQQYIEKNIIQALHLENTYVGYRQKIENELATGYTRPDLNNSRLPMTNAIDTKATCPSRGFCSTGEDLCQFFLALSLGSKALLDDQSKKEMQRTEWLVKAIDKREYGLGVAIEYCDGRRTFGHGGTAPGHMSITLCDPKNELIVSVLANCIDADSLLIAKSIFSVIGYFETNMAKVVPANNLKKFQGRFMNLWSIIDVVAIGNKLVAASPNLWQPFIDAEELEQISNNTFKVVKANGYSWEGELVHFDIGKTGEIKSIKYCGMTLWPENVYLKTIADKKIIGQSLQYAL
jgi:D-alanyl-D-alanine carboxypeptidase